MIDTLRREQNLGYIYRFIKTSNGKTSLILAVGAELSLEKSDDKDSPVLWISNRT